MRKQTSHIILFCLLASFVSQGQDVHFSSWDANPMFQNPALTAFSSNTLRAGVMYRNQWSTVSNGYNTYLLSVEALPYNSYQRHEGIGLGVMFIGDAAGQLSYGSQEIALSLSYFKCIDRMSSNYISLGLQTATTSWGFSIAKARFGRNEAESYEGILLKDARTFDLSLGFHQQFELGADNIFLYGLAAYHLNSPQMSFYENEDIILPRKYKLYAQYDIPCAEGRIKPGIFLQKQDKYYECNLGTEYSLSLAGGNISFGGYYRLLDAFCLIARYNINNLTTTLAYDVNLSRLTPASSTYGGVEISLLYGFSKFNSSHPKTSIPCPTF